MPTEVWPIITDTYTADVLTVLYTSDITPKKPGFFLITASRSRTRYGGPAPHGQISNHS